MIFIQPWWICGHKVTILKFSWIKNSIKEIKVDNCWYVRITIFWSVWVNSLVVFPEDGSLTGKKCTFSVRTDEQNILLPNFLFPQLTKKISFSQARHFFMNYHVVWPVPSVLGMKTMYTNTTSCETLIDQVSVCAL